VTGGAGHRKSRDQLARRPQPQPALRRQRTRILWSSRIMKAIGSSRAVTRRCDRCTSVRRATEHRQSGGAPPPPVANTVGKGDCDPWSWLGGGCDSTLLARRSLRIADSESIQPDPRGATLDTGAVIAAGIGAAALLATQIATMVQVHKQQRRTEAFENSQTEANNKFLDQQRRGAEQSAEQLAKLESELTQVFSLQTRWDPVRFQIYAEVLSCADDVWPVAVQLASLAKHREIVYESKEEGRIDSRTYEARSAELSDEIQPYDEKWTVGLRALEAARGRSDMIASPPVRDAVTALVHSVQRMRAARALISQNYEFEHPFYDARDAFRESVRFELGSDHYAAEQVESS
jgi:hypothetical protein